MSLLRDYPMHVKDTMSPWAGAGWIAECLSEAGKPPLQVQQPNLAYCLRKLIPQG